MSAMHPLAIIDTASITSLVRTTLYHHSISVHHTQVEMNEGVAALGGMARRAAKEDSTMNKYSNQSKGRHVFAAQQKLHAVRPEPVAAALVTHEDIARHAYEIYVETGRRQDQSEQNWLQAERELKNQQNWLQAGRDGTHQDPAGYPGAY